MKDNSNRESKAKPLQNHAMKSKTNDPIAAALRQLHDDVVSEPVPDDFLRLLSEIDQKIGREKDSA